MEESYDKPSFLIYKHFFMSISHLSNEDLGLLFRTICEYQGDRSNLEYVDPKIEIAFKFLSTTVKYIVSGCAGLFKLPTL